MSNVWFAHLGEFILVAQMPWRENPARIVRVAALHGFIVRMIQPLNAHPVIQPEKPGSSNLPNWADQSLDIHLARPLDLLHIGTSTGLRLIR